MGYTQPADFVTIVLFVANVFRIDNDDWLSAGIIDDGIDLISVFGAIFQTTWLYGVIFSLPPLP